MEKDLDIGRATCHDVSVVDLVISSLEILPFANEFEVFEFNPFLSEVNCPVSQTSNHLYSSK